MVVVRPYHTLAILVDNLESAPDGGANKHTNQKRIDLNAHLNKLYRNRKL